MAAVCSAATLVQVCNASSQRKKRIALLKHFLYPAIAIRAHPVVTGPLPYRGAARWSGSPRPSTSATRSLAVAAAVCVGGGGAGLSQIGRGASHAASAAPANLPRPAWRQCRAPLRVARARSVRALAAQAGSLSASGHCSPGHLAAWSCATGRHITPTGVIQLQVTELRSSKLS